MDFCAVGARDYTRRSNYFVFASRGKCANFCSSTCASSSWPLQWLVPSCNIFDGRITRSPKFDSQVAAEKCLADTELYSLVDGQQESKLLFVAAQNPMDFPKERLARMLLELKSWLSNSALIVPLTYIALSIIRNKWRSGILQPSSRPRY